MSNKITHLFVYGTLRKGFSSPVLERLAGGIEWVGYSSIKGTLYDIGNYPGAVPLGPESSLIKGEIFKIIEAETVLHVLDNYEGIDPERIQVPEYYRQREWFELEDGSKIEAWIYWYNFPVEGRKEIPGNDYLKYLQNN